MHVDKPPKGQCVSCVLSGPQSGILSSLLLAVAFISSILGGLLADFLHSRKIFRLVTIRKLSTAIGKDTDGCWGGAGSSGWFLFTLCLSSCGRGSYPICGPRVPALGPVQHQHQYGLVGTVFQRHHLLPDRSAGELLGYCSSVGTPWPHPHRSSAQVPRP